MRYTIETAPKNGNIVILEDDTSGFLEVLTGHRRQVNGSEKAANRLR
jgi:hypothetical protein